MTKPKNMSDQLPAIRVDPDLMTAIREDMKANFEDSAAPIVRARLSEFYGRGTPAPLAQSPEQVAKDDKARMENQLLELKLQRERRSLIERTKAFELVGRDYAAIRSRLNAIPASVIGLTPEQYEDLKKLVQDCMTDLSAERQEAWNDID